MDMMLEGNSAIKYFKNTKKKHFFNFRNFIYIFSVFLK